MPYLENKVFNFEICVVISVRDTDTSFSLFRTIICGLIETSAYFSVLIVTSTRLHAIVLKSRLLALATIEFMFAAGYGLSKWIVAVKEEPTQRQCDCEPGALPFQW